ncbi:MAG: glycoside hydrolase family 3 C-terminal domain-containing protein [Lachnospiraceae bacterium]|nr:glycoside hydrolase family 3 C-terminal domain-containing protein [Lachnospiraceae bacterium]
MNREMKERKLSGVPFADERDYEIRNRQIAREAAAEGMVLLKNENHMLPIPKGTSIALYGAGAAHTIKGGIGSGDVNSRETVSVWKGLTDAGYQIVSKKWLDEYDETYTKARLKWRDDIWQKTDTLQESIPDLNFFYAYSTIPFVFPVGGLPEKEDAEIAMYVLSRKAGEGKDRVNADGDYMVSEEEKQIIDKICELYPHVVLVLNTGGVIDLSFTDDYPNIESIIYMHQPGMEAGNAFADLVSGSVVPGGKLTDSWPCAYSDYPNASVYSHNNGNVDKEEYIEGIYVGYRYFDTFQIPVRYSFGYGLSYTSFSIEILGIEHFNLGTQEPEIGVKVKVTNTGEHYAGREVVQIYISCPQDKLDKEYRRLAGFCKTRRLAPGESQEETIRFAVSTMASYHESQSAWMVEEGCYGIFVGNSLETSVFSASIQMDGDAVLIKTEHICPLQECLDELKGIPEKVNERRSIWLKEVAARPEITVHSFDIIRREVSYERIFHDFSDEVANFVDNLQTGQLIELATGDISKAQGSSIGAAGNSVPGSAAQTSGCAAEQGLASIVLADGPAGLRLNRTYQAVNGKPISMPVEMAMEDGYLARGQYDREGETYYQYCTAIPVGTALAQSWDTEIMKKCGRAVAEEMQEFGVTLWLAPGMNIHRNPLCGRNFEYYSEDPLLSGIMAAAMTDGVQSRKGCGTTIKHFACNNQEDNRMHSDSIVSERALREIYLKGFEIAVKKSQPMAIMTSYNLVNGIHAANSYDLCTKAARNEWGYQGLIMTDWTTTNDGTDCTASGCIRAGNDIVMPGCDSDHKNLKEELERGTLELRELKLAVGHLVNIIWQSSCEADSCESVQ